MQPKTGCRPRAHQQAFNQKAEEGRAGDGGSAMGAYEFESDLKRQRKRVDQFIKEERNIAYSSDR